MSAESSSAGPGFDPDAYTRSSREAWSCAAQVYADENARRLEPYGLALLERLELGRIARGTSVLDIASGPGEPALALARSLAGRSRVTGVDLSSEMVRIAGQRARAAGLANVEFREADAHRLPFEDHSFDLVTCRFGLMLMAAPLAVAREVCRVLKPGGRFGFTVWAESAREGPTGILRQVMTDLVPVALLPPGPDMFALGDPRVTTRLVEAAGLAMLAIQALSSDWEFEDPGEYWHSMTHGSPNGRALARLPADLALRIEAETLRRLGSLSSADGSLRLPAEALVALAGKG